MGFFGWLKAIFRDNKQTKIQNDIEIARSIRHARRCEDWEEAVKYRWQNRAALRGRKIDMVKVMEKQTADLNTLQHNANFMLSMPVAKVTTLRTFTHQSKGFVKKSDDYDHYAINFASDDSSDSCSSNDSSSSCDD